MQLQLEFTKLRHSVPRQSKTLHLLKVYICNSQENEHPRHLPAEDMFPDNVPRAYKGRTL